MNMHMLHRPPENTPLSQVIHISTRELPLEINFELVKSQSLCSFCLQVNVYVIGNIFFPSARIYLIKHFP